MRLPTARRGLITSTVAAIALLLSAAPMSAPALAAGSCGNGTWFTTAAVGTFAEGEFENWYRTQPDPDANGFTFIDVVPGNGLGLRVLDADCTQVLCARLDGGAKLTCSGRWEGPLNVSVVNLDGTAATYAVTITDANGPGSPARRSAATASTTTSTAPRTTPTTSTARRPTTTARRGPLRLACRCR